MRRIALQLGLLALASCSLKPPFVILTIEDPQGYGDGSERLAIGFEQGAPMRTVARNGTPFPLTVTVTTVRAEDAVVFVEARDDAGVVLARGAAAVNFRSAGTPAATVPLGRPCDNAAACDDGVFCNGQEACVDGVCRSEQPPCGTSFACVQSTCIELSGGAGECNVSVNHTLCETPSGTPAYCDTTLGCVPGDPCLDDSGCDDGITCNGLERCVGFHCIAGAPLQVEDADPCTTDGCNDARTLAGLEAVFHVSDPANDGNQCLLPTNEPGVCSAARAGCVKASCGDGIVTSALLEDCDDAGASSGDGCDEHCHVEPGWSCAGQPTTCTSVCGDQITVGSEECDAGVNSDLCDGCRSNCTLIAGFGCGDGIVCGSEACDLGGPNNDGDYGGCDADCTFAAFCGDGTIDGGNGESCDDGDVLSLDGCNSACQVELGFQCSGMPSSCATVCGDYIVRGSEACDEGPLGDACSNCRADCTLVPGFGCGDGAVCGGETCDLGVANNNGSYGGCTMSCQRAAHCGDTIVQGANGETCDQGELNSTSAGSLCSPTCQRQFWVMGTQTGLAGHGSLTLKLSGGNPLSLSTDELFVLPTPLTNGTSYQAEISTVSLSSPGHCQLREATGVINGESTTTLVSECFRRVAKVSAGRQSTCAILFDGSVRCWGMNGVLGLGDDFARGIGEEEMGPYLPAVSLGTGRTALLIETGETRACAVLDTQELKCWGTNESGKLGIGDTEPRGNAPDQMGDLLPGVQLGTGRTAVELALGANHTCARLDNGTVKCWGDNANGQLGLGDTVDRGDNANEMGNALPPVALGAGLTAVEIDASLNTTCARLNDGSVKCWGSVYGVGSVGPTNLGNAANEMGDNLPKIALGSGRTAVEIDVGNSHVCARLDDDSVKCWGSNSEGQLGLGDLLTRGDGPNEMGDNLPVVALGTGRKAVQLALGDLSTCARFDDGSIRCWGSNGLGTLGIGSTSDRGSSSSHMGNNLIAVDLGTGRTAVDVSMNGLHVCARLDNGLVKCWGNNDYGQLGLGDFDNHGSAPGQMGDALVAPNTGW